MSPVRLQRFPSQQTNDGPHPENLLPDQLVSNGEGDDEDEVIEDAAGPVEEGVEHPEDAGASGSGRAGESLPFCTLRECSDDDVDELTDAGHAASSATPADAGPAIRRRLRKAADAAPAGEQTAEERPHGKHPGGP